MMKKTILLLALVSAAGCAFSDTMAKDNVAEKLEFSYSGDQNAVFVELMDFLKGKWNLDNEYAVEVLGFLSGYLPNHPDAIEYYRLMRNEIRNERLVGLLDGISDGEFESTVRYLDQRRLNQRGYLWFVCFGNFSEGTIDCLLDSYSLSVDDSDFPARMEIRYFYERHDLVKKAVDKRNGTLFERVREKSYEELHEEFSDRVRNMSTER